MNPLTVRAPAKINLYLRITGRRPDGMHEIETLFQKVDLYDELAFEESHSDELITRESPWPLGDFRENLIWRALNALRSEPNVDFPRVRIALVKRIPPGAGLGGGSADAAATLRGLIELFGLDLPPRALDRIALGLGADVPFLLSPHTCAVGIGVGEILKPVAHSVHWPCTIIYPGIHSSTPDAYRRWDESDSHGEATNLASLCEALRTGNLKDAQRLVFNDFTPVLREAYPELDHAMNWLLACGFQSPWPTGSGSAVFALGSVDQNKSSERLPAEFHRFEASLL